MQLQSCELKLHLILILSHSYEIFRTHKFSDPRTTKTYINLGSYNYLGFAETSGELTNRVITTCSKFGLVSCSNRQEAGRAIF